MAALDRAALEALRDRRFRRRPGSRVTGARSALAFVDAVGFCSTFYRFPDAVPCLWEAVVGRANPRWPRHSHHDRGVGLTWELKDVLPARKLVYYGKVLRGRPLLVSLELFPSFYALVRGRQRARDYQVEYEAGRLSATARHVMRALVREHPQYTRELRANCFLLDPSRTREFERAMAELQQGLWVVKTEERYEPSFSYRWDLVESWVPEHVARGRAIARPAAIGRLIERYVETAAFTTERSLARLFALPRSEVAAAVSALARRGIVLVDRSIEGLAGRFIVARTAIAGRRGAARRG
jgi:hypothetical protein